MYIEVVPNRNSPPAVLLRECWREGSKVTVQALIFRWTSAANHGKLILGAAGQ
jgi:hypothetical protein